MKVLGIDPSSTSTGLARPDGSVRLVRLSSLSKGSKVGVRMGRIARIVSEVRSEIERAGGLDLVAIEGYSYGSTFGAIGQAELGGILRWELWQQSIVVVELAPKTLKKFATDDGRATKTAMVIAARERLGYETVSDDEADAIWLRAAGLALLGHPLPAVPVSRIRGLSKTVER